MTPPTALCGVRTSGLRHDAGVEVRVVGGEEIAAAAETLAGAFGHDPVWGWVFSDPDRRHAHLTGLWGLFLEGSVGYGWVSATPGLEASALWIPPGCPELPEPQASRLEPMLEELAGSRARLVTEVLDVFEAAHPHDRDHYYLSLLGTHPAHRGRGLGMALLSENLAAIDEAGAPAYLESTNPDNLVRYGSVGFEVIGEFSLPHGGPTVTTMWREPADPDPAVRSGQVTDGVLPTFEPCVRPPVAPRWASLASAPSPSREQRWHTIRS